MPGQHDTSVSRTNGVVLAAMFVAASAGAKALADDEAFIVTPPGFTDPGAGEDGVRREDRPGSGSRSATAPPAGRRPAGSTSSGPTATSTSRPPIRSLPISLTGQWPKTGKGNREGKAPIRYLGRFFYTTGEIEVAVPAGQRARRGLEGDSSTGRRAKSVRRSPPVETIAVDLVLERTAADGRRSATTRATRTSTSRARPRPTTASSSTCSRPRTSSSARSWPTTSRPARTRA